MSQKTIVLKQLRDTGTVSRNEYLHRIPAITRLGAIIKDLRDEGMDIDTNYTTKPINDCIYTLKDKPQIVNYYVQGQIVATKKIW